MSNIVYVRVFDWLEMQGSLYHESENCKYLRLGDYIEMDKKEAKKKHKTPCPICC